MEFVSRAQDVSGQQSDTNLEDSHIVHSESKRNMIRRIFSTTSSVYADHSIMSPDADQVFFCLAVILQSQIYEDLVDSHQGGHISTSDFDLLPDMDPEIGGHCESVPDSIIERETKGDPWLKDYILAGVVPPVDTILRFVTMIHQRTTLPVECNIIALIYVNRITTMGSFTLTWHNWRMLWTSCVILAQKFWIDKPYKTSTFSAILRPITTHQLRCIESRAWTLMQNKTMVTSSTYARYYFELRQLYNEMTEASGIGKQWAVKSLTILEAKKLDERSKRTLQGGSGRSQTESGIFSQNGRPRLISATRGEDRANPDDTGSCPLCSVAPVGPSRDTGMESGDIKDDVMGGGAPLRAPRKSFRGLKSSRTLEDVTRSDTSRYVLS